MDNSTDNAQIHIAGLWEVKIEEYSATEAVRIQRSSVAIVRISEISKCGLTMLRNRSIARMAPLHAGAKRSILVAIPCLH